MIRTYTKQANILKQDEDAVFNDSTIWIDLLNITSEEEKLVEDFLGIDIPTLEEIQQIEISQRLYIENNALYITIAMLTVNETEFPGVNFVTFILYKDKIVTIRYTELKSFNAFSNKLNKYATGYYYEACDIFCELLKNLIGRVSDTLESIHLEMNEHNMVIFADANKNSHLEYHKILKEIGYNGNLLAKCRESLVSLTRAVNFILKTPNFNEQKIPTLNILLTDINSINEFANFLSGEMAFLLDATLGMITIEQNYIFKISSTVSILFMPPTLIASIYGMNFNFMPELHFQYGYPVALTLMVISILITYKFFKIKKWM